MRKFTFQNLKSCQIIVKKVLLVTVFGFCLNTLFSEPIYENLDSGTTQITLDFGQNSVSGNFSVFGNNLCGNGMPSPGFPVNVYPVPSAPIASVNGQIVESNVFWGINGILK
ncbi:MAG: hypothetical protein WCL00_13485 [Bacteroidota bacterium]